MQLPSAFLSNLASVLSAEEISLLQAALQTDAPTSVRSNPWKYRAEGTPVPWCETGVYLAERPSFTADPLFHAGCYYVQEASSMFVEQAWRTISQRIDAPRRVLDLCAAPGGKSTLWRALLPAETLLVANEPVPLRASVLVENLTKWGHSGVCVSRAYPREFAALDGFFDIIAADVPCSGEGLFRRQPEAIEEWTPQSPQRCAERQMEIVRDVWPALREGGFLVYSTCTFNRMEDEENVARICRELGAEAVPIATESTWGVVESEGPSYRFFPHRVKGEGFFIALLQKTSPCPESSKKRPKPLATISPKKIPTDWLASPADFRFVSSGDSVAALPQTHFEAIERIAAAVRLLAAGVQIYEKKGEKQIPASALALSLALNREAFPLVELSREQALSFLHGEALPAFDAPRGYVLLAFEGRPLGFANNLPARANNLYPKEWRIRRNISDL